MFVITLPKLLRPLSKWATDSPPGVNRVAGESDHRHVPGRDRRPSVKQDPGTNRAPPAWRPANQPDVVSADQREVVQQGRPAVPSTALRPATDPGASGPSLLHVEMLGRSLPAQPPRDGVPPHLARHAVAAVGRAAVEGNAVAQRRMHPGHGRSPFRHRRGGRPARTTVPRGPLPPPQTPLASTATRCCCPPRRAPTAPRAAGHPHHPGCCRPARFRTRPVRPSSLAAASRPAGRKSSPPALRGVLARRSGRPPRL